MVTQEEYDQASRAHQQLLSVDRGALPPQQQAEHDHKCIVGGARLSAMGAAIHAARRLALRPTKDERPSMLPPPSPAK